ncbi:hypothetical protein [Streptomyces sp. NPDC017949]|uniref:hypothetical protein n=1 Tax=Streptomyces sp. NPDC017949 TaxID=3365020 RepID=UPI003790EEA1
MKDRTLASIYRESRLFTELRDPSLLRGRCGACEYKAVCRGSRSRAYGATGDVLAADPYCAYEPGSFPYPREVAALTESTMR